MSIRSGFFPYWHNYRPVEQNGQEIERQLFMSICSGLFPYWHSYRPVEQNGQEIEGVKPNFLEIV